MKLYMFRAIPLSIIRSFHCTHSNGICHTGLPTTCKQDQDGTRVPSWSCSQTVYKPVWHIPLLCVQRKTPDGGQRNCPKHVEFHSENKFEKSMHLVRYYKKWNTDIITSTFCRACVVVNCNGFRIHIHQPPSPLVLKNRTTCAAW